MTVSNEWKQDISKHFQYQILLLYKLIEWRRSEIIYINLQWQGENRDYSLEINPIYVEIRALSEWNTNISITHAQRYHIYFCNHIFTFTFIGLICCTKHLWQGGHPWPDTGCWRKIGAMLKRSGGSIPIFSHRLKDIISRQKGEWRKCSAGVWWLPGLDDGWIGWGGGGEEVASLIVARVGGGW